MSVVADAGDEVPPVPVASVPVVHDLHLSQVNGFQADVDPALGHVEEPHPRLKSAHVGHGGALVPVIVPVPEAVQHLPIVEVP